MKGIVYDLNGKEKAKIDLPGVFYTEYRPDLIKRAVISALTSRIQAWSSNQMAGKRTTATNRGTGYGTARVRRVKAGTKRKGRRGRPYSPKFRSFPAAGVAAFVPQARGGRRAHPPKGESILTERINKKERRKAIRSAIAATVNKDLVILRNQRAKPDLPIIIEDKFQEIKKSKEALDVLKNLKMEDEMRLAGKKRIRAGRGKTRGRKYRIRKGPLIVVEKDLGIKRAVLNLGAEVTRVDQLNAEALSPGAHGARLTLWTESAINRLEEIYK